MPAPDPWFSLSQILRSNRKRPPVVRAKTCCFQSWHLAVQAHVHLLEVMDLRERPVSEHDLPRVRQTHGFWWHAQQPQGTTGQTIAERKVSVGMHSRGRGASSVSLAFLSFKSFFSP